MTDVGDVAVTAVRARLEPACPDTLVEVVETHAVRAADQQSRRADLRRDPLAERRLAVAREHERGHQRRGTRAMRNHFVECAFDPGVADGQDHVLDGRGQGGERREARHAADGGVTRVHGVQRPRESAFQQVLDGGAPDGADALGGAQHRDRARPEQGVEPVRHVGHASPRDAQKSAAGSARRRGGSKNAPSTTRQRAITRAHLSSRW